jgi:hypothetical protein
VATPKKVDLGAFAAGEVPPPLEITFRDFEEAVVDLTGFTSLQMNIDEELGSNNNPLGTGVIAMTDAPNGLVTYGWVRDDMFDPGEYTSQAWVDNGVNFFASDLYIYSIYDGPGSPP